MTPRALGAVCIALLLGLGCGLLAAHLLSSPAGIVVEFSPTPLAGSGVRVYVSGAVQNPGVYQVHAGDRIVDAVDAAGGPTADADTEAVNFALRIQDEEQIHIPRVGEIAVAASDSAIAVVATATPAAPVQRVDINHADVNLLRTLPGVGQVRAANIVASRQTAGPFKQPQDLVLRKLLTQKIFDQDKDRIEALP
jgi:competence protein ComEA